MKLLNLIQLAALSGVGFAAIIPDQEVFQVTDAPSSPQQDHTSREQSKSRFRDDLVDALDQFAGDVEDIMVDYTNKAKDSFQGATRYASSKGQKLSQTIQEATHYASSKGEELGHGIQETYTEAGQWVDTAKNPLGVPKEALGHGGHGHKPNQTVYQLIASSKYTTKLAELIDEFPDLVKTLNGTKANYTVFAPTDYAFEKIPKHAPKPSKEQLKTLLTYHVSSDFYPAGRVLVTKTIPTLLESELLGDNPQRLSTNVGLRGLTVNFYARIIAIDIFGTNGVIHGVDSLIIPPPRAIEIVDLIPSAFSTLELGLSKTGLLDILNDTHRAGGTLFAPSNGAFERLGPRVNAFLFSRYGLKYLKPLLEYHVAPKRTLYSDAYYGPKDDDDSDDGDGEKHAAGGPPKGFYHYELPTLLEDRKISVDVARYARLIELRINGFSRVAVADGVARDGVIQVVGNVLIPPKQRPDDGHDDHADDGEMSVEELKERLAPFVKKECGEQEHPALGGHGAPMIDDREVLIRDGQI